jgi:hypothetical protein
MGLGLKCEFPTLQLMHVYEVRPRKDHRGVDLISGVLPFDRLQSFLIAGRRMIRHTSPHGSAFIGRLRGTRAD